MSAIISQCGKYRYSLSRSGDLLDPEKRKALFIMLNPSTADATADDPTIRRCISFSDSLYLNGLIVGNLYALRATDPKELWQADDPIGIDNDRHLLSMMQEIKHVICAWGNNAKPDRVKDFVALAEQVGASLWCLGINKSGQPKHPLYIKANQKLIKWETGQKGA